MQVKNIILNFVMLAGLGVLNTFAQTSWEVNPNDFVYSMTITGQLNTDGYISADVNDVIAAFIDDECRGITNVKYQQTIDGFFVFLMIYSNEPTGTISFIIYDASKNQEFPVKNTINFNVNGIVGSISNPYIFSASDLNSESDLLTYTIPNQVGETVISGNDVYLQERWDGNLMGITAIFTLSDGAKAYIGSIEQISGVTINHFINPVQYLIESADHSSSKVYTVHITIANDIPTDILLSENQKSENEQFSLIGYLETITENPAEVHEYSLIPGEENDNHLFYINGNELHAKQVFNYEEQNSYQVKIRADDKKGGVIDKLFEITVLNKNDDPTNVVLTEKHTPQSVLSHTVIGKLVAIDEDYPDNHTFTIINGNGENDKDNDLFYIEGNKLKNKIQIYFFSSTEYRVFIRVTDSSGSYCDVAMNINTIEQGMPPHSLKLSNSLVTGINNPPIFVGILSTEDIDQVLGHRYDFLLYPAQGPDNSYFEIKENALYLKKPRPISEKSEYQILIATIDSMENFYSRVFIIEVKEKLGESEFYLDNDLVYENKSVNTVVGSINSSVYNCMEYNFSLPLEVDLTTYDNDKFTLNGRTILTNQVFDFEKDNSFLVRIRVSDGDTEIEQDIPIKVANNNDPPSGIILSTQQLEEATPIGTELATLTAIDQDASDTHYFSLVLGNGFNDEGNTSFNILGNKLILAKPLNYELKEFYNILVKATDVGGESITQGVRLQVTDANDAPEITSIPDTYVLQDNVYVYAIKITDSEGDAVSITFEGLPGWLTFNEETNILSGVPLNNHVGVYSFSVIASDGNKQSVQQVNLTVINVNDAPIINYVPGTQDFFTGKENEVMLPANCIVDPDIGDVLTFSLLGEGNTALPAWLHFSSEKLILSGNPPGDARGEYRLKLTATDQGFLKEYLIFILSVKFPVSVGEPEKIKTFKTYPNPANNFLCFDIPNDLNEAIVNVCNMSGQTLQSLVFDGGSKKTIPFNVSPGIYIIYYKQGEKQKVEKIIKK